MSQEESHEERPSRQNAVTQKPVRLALSAAMVMLVVVGVYLVGRSVLEAQSASCLAEQQRELEESLRRPHGGGLRLLAPCPGEGE